MTEISGVREDLRIDRFEVQDDLPKQEIPAQVEERLAAPGESESRMKAEEALQKAMLPNLRALDREQKIMAQLEVVTSLQARFLLLKELFKIKVEEFKKSGESFEKFVKEVRDLFNSNEPNIETLFKGPQANLKRDLYTLYIQMGAVADEMKDKFYSYNSPFLKLYELELETGYTVGQTALLAIEQLSHREMLKKFASSSFFGAVKSVDFYWNVVIPDTLKILEHLEKSGDEEMLKRSMKGQVMGFFEIFKVKFFQDRVEGKDPLVLFFPYIVKYESLDKIKSYFDVRYKDLSHAERTYLWIDLHCQAAELLASIDAQKSSQYLKQAKMIRDNDLWAYPFSFRRGEIEAKAQLAQARIEEATQKAS